MIIALYTLVFCTVLMLVGGIYALMRTKDPVLQRMGTPGNTDHVLQTSLRKEKENIRLDKFLKPFQEKLKKEQEDNNFSSERTSTLRAAGYYGERAGATLYAIRLTLAIFMSIGLATVFVVSGLTLKPIFATLIVVIVGAIGYYAPLLFVSLKAKERRLQFSEGLPDALDMILICLESGLSFPASLKHVAKEFREVHPVVSENFEIVNLEFQAGRKRADALRNLALRVDLQELTSVVNMVNQSEALGTSLTRAIRAAALDMRRDRMLRAEEKANALPVKMAIPLTTCIFPTLFCIIIVPVVIRIVTLLPG